MIKGFSKYRVFITFAIVLLPLSILLFHSEHCSLTESETEHHLHDCCEILQNIIIEKTSISNLNFLSRNFVISFLNICSDQHGATSQLIVYLEYQDFHYPSQTRKVYLYNNILLI